MLTKNSCTLLVVLQLIAIFISRTEGSANVDRFVQTFQSDVKSNTKLQDTMTVADLDGDQVAKTYYKVVKKILQDVGNPHSSDFAKKVQVAVEKTFCMIDSSSEPIVLSTFVANILENKGILTDDNAEKLANDYASAMLLVLETSDSSPPEVYVQGIMESFSNLFTALKVPFFGDFDDKIKRYYETVDAITN